MDSEMLADMLETIQEQDYDISFFPERTIAHLDADKKAMTLEHVLTMATGL